MTTTANFLATQLGDISRDRLREHFLQLNGEDRHLRFGSSLNDCAVINYVDSIDFERDEIYAVIDATQNILGVVHIAILAQEAELGLSVLVEARGLGVGNALFERAVMRLRNRCVHEVLVRCLHQNVAMMHLAHKYGMQIRQDGTDREARLVLPAATSGTHMLEWLQNQQANYIGSVQDNMRLGQMILAAFNMGPALKKAPSAVTPR